MKKYLLLLLFPLWLCQLWAAPKLPAIISDGMVIQRDLSAPIWGWGNPGERVSLKFNKQRHRTEVGEDGKWMVKLKPSKASHKPTSMTIQVGEEKVTLINILVGEVWLCSGQSNMDWDLNKLMNKAKDPRYQPIVEEITKVATETSDRSLRQIIVPHKTSYNKALQDFDGKWLESNPENNGVFSGTAIFFAKELRKELDVPVGLIKAPWGGKPIEPFIPPAEYMADPELKAYYENYMKDVEANLAKYNPEKAKADYEKRLSKWKEAVKQAKAEKKPAPRRPGMQQSPALSTSIPGTLYNAMIHPVIPYGIKGAIWYQGESNRRNNWDKYARHIDALITGWRKAWGQDDFPLYYCQLAGYKEPVEGPEVLTDYEGWVIVCDQMRRALSVKNTGMAVLNDIGEANDIHPRNKIDAGKRLAYWALAKDYGRTEIDYSGPLYQSHEIKDGKIIITFDEVAEGLMVGKKILLDPVIKLDEPVDGFHIQDQKGKWHWAKANIISNNQVEVYHPEIENPKAARYAWAVNPVRANLYNKAGLPTSVFTTEE